MASRGWIVLVAVGLLVALTAVSFPLWAVSVYPVTSIPSTLDPDTTETLQFEELDPDSQAVVEAAVANERTTVTGAWGIDNRSEAGVPAIVADHQLGDERYGALVTYRGEVYDIVSPAQDHDGEPVVVVGGGIVLGILLFGAGIEFRREKRSPYLMIGLVYVGLAAILAMLSVGNIVAYL